jgi:hypothetical protein
MTTESEIDRVKSLVRHTELELKYTLDMLRIHRQQLADLLRKAATADTRQEARP